MAVKNIKEAKALVSLYRSITVEDLAKENLYEITGFGSTHTCMLCSPCVEDLTPNCKKCIYSTVPYDDNSLSLCVDELWHDMSDSANQSMHEKTVTLINKRADYIEGLVKKYENGQN